MAGTTKGSLVELTVSETLYRAADLIEERGWATGPDGWPGFDDDQDANTTPLCVEGGIMAALGLRASGAADDVLVDIEKCPAYIAVQSYLETDEPLYRFNDARESASEVIEVLRACALLEAAREEQDAAWQTYAEVVTA